MKRIVMIFTGILFFLVGGWWIFSPVEIIGKSMQPALQDRSYRFVNRAAYWVFSPQRGDIVLYEVLGRDQVGRVVGMPGETVQLAGSAVLINGTPMDEPYAVYETPLPDTVKKDLVAGDGEYVVLGDNRNHSRDSRYEGPVGRRNILGRFW